MASYLDVSAEAGGVVVAEGARVAEGLEQRRRLQHLLRDQVRRRRVHRRQELQQQLRALSLARAGLAAQDDGLRRAVRTFITH